MTQTLANLDALPPNLRRMVLAELTAKEELIWLEQPNPRRFARLGIVPMLFALPIIAWAFHKGRFTMDIVRGPTGFMTVFMGLIGLMLLFLIALVLTAPYWIERKLLQAAYVVTDRRAIIFVCGILWKIKRSFGPAQLGDIRRRRRRDGSGDVLFARAAFPSGFYGVSDPDGVAELLGLLAQAGPAMAQEEAAELEAQGLPAGMLVPRNPISKNSASFRTARLVIPSADLAEVRATLAIKLFYSALLVPGAIVLLLVMKAHRVLIGAGSTTAVAVAALILCALVGELFKGLGMRGLSRKSGHGSVTFDRRTGRMWTRRRSFGPEARRQGIPLSDIRALQICFQRVSGKSSFTCYELNLVLGGPEQVRRLTLMSHGNLPALSQDAGTLAVFLGVPLLDHTDGR